jgi:hypothetical protein
MLVLKSSYRGFYLYSAQPEYNGVLTTSFSPKKKEKEKKKCFLLGVKRGFVLISAEHNAPPLLQRDDYLVKRNG